MKRSSVTHDFRRNGDLVGQLRVEYQGTMKAGELYSFTLRDSTGAVLQQSEIPVSREDEHHAGEQGPTRVDIRDVAAMIIDVIREQGDRERSTDSEIQQQAWELDPNDEAPDIEWTDATRAWAEINQDLLLEAQQMILAGPSIGH